MRSGRGPQGAGRHLFRVFPRIIDVPAYVISRGRTGFAIGARGRRGPAAPPGGRPRAASLAGTRGNAAAQNHGWAGVRTPHAQSYTQTLDDPGRSPSTLILQHQYPTPPPGDQGKPQRTRHTQNDTVPSA